MGVGCDEVGVCYAAAHDTPKKCPRYDHVACAAQDLLNALRAVELARFTDREEDWDRATKLTDSAFAKARGEVA